MVADTLNFFDFAIIKDTLYYNWAEEMPPFIEIEPNRAEPMRARMDEYGAVVRQIAERRQAIFVEAQAAFDGLMKEMHPMSLAWDRLHPNQTGHMLLARAFLAAIGFTWQHHLLSMTPINRLDLVVAAQKRGEARGIPSICSAHPWALKTALRGETPVLIESTCDQVNQFGGYTGMTPADFVRFVRGIAAENGFPPEKILLGGNRLGPAPWQTGPTERAMSRAADMVRAYVQAGYTKLHLDAGMKLGDDDPLRPLDLELAARRTAWLAKIAEETFAKVPEPAQRLRYVIGTEVPPPGGAAGPQDSVRVTPVEEARRTLEVTRAAFVEAGLEAAWERVSALVVQPGVEFGDDFVHEYDPAAAAGLARFSETTRFVYEAHSTDYQTRDNLAALVRDHFAILKVGPALTFAFREAVFSLAMIESELFAPEERSRLLERLEAAMQREPSHWKNHYHGSQQRLALARKYSLSDRVRYYWPEPDVQAALSKLLGNLESAAPLPLALVSQYLPEMADEMRSGRLPNRAPAIIARKIEAVLEDYRAACG